MPEKQLHQAKPVCSTGNQLHTLERAEPTTNKRTDNLTGSHPTTRCSSSTEQPATNPTTAPTIGACQFAPRQYPKNTMMNRTRLSIGSALGFTLKKSSPVDVVDKGGHGKQKDIEDEIGPLTASPPVSPATRISSSSASFFPTNSTARHNSHNSNAAKHLPLKDLNRNGSFAVHNLPKLRESKWFAESEQRIFSVVVEIGFIVEIRRAVEKTDGDTNSCINKETPKEYKSLFGVVTKKECINSQSAEGVCIFYKL